MQAIDQIAPDNPVQAENSAITEGISRGVKLGCTGIGANQVHLIFASRIQIARIGIAAKKVKVLAEVVVQLERKIVIGARSRRVEFVSQEIDAIPLSWVVAGRQHAPQSLHRWTKPDVAWVCSCQVVQHAIKRERAVRIRWIQSTKSVAGYDALLSNGLIKAPRFVRGEEESLVFLNRAANRKTAAVIANCRTRDSKRVVVPAVRVERAVLKIPVGHAMEIIAAAAARNGDLGSRRAPEGGIGIRNAYAKFRYAVHTERNDDRVHKNPARVVGDVDAVERHVVLVRARAGDPAAVGRKHVPCAGDWR